MKHALFILAVSAFVACSQPTISERLVAVAPALPDSWSAALGPPSWLFFWYGPDGAPRSAESSGGSVDVEIPDAAASPVLAYPHWPEHGIGAGAARPAGAVFPFGCQDRRLPLSWRGGVAAVFYRELLNASGPADRLPQYFDWPRFLELFESDALEQAVLDDPWRVDWRTAAIKTRAAGFDRRRLKSRGSSTLTIALPASPRWVGSSPFAPDRGIGADGTAALEAGSEPDTLLSRDGLVRFCGRSWAWFPKR